jgi:hypothetical protein
MSISFRSVLLAVALAATVIPAASQDAKTFEKSAVSTVRTHTDKEGNPIIHIVNRRFTMVQLFNGGENPDGLLLLEEFDTERNLHAEGQKGTVRVEAGLGTEVNPSKPVWTLTQEGDTGDVSEPFYKVTRYGCCSALNTDIYFNLRTGRKVFTSTTELGKITVPNAGDAFNRFISFRSLSGSIRLPEFDADHRVVGVIEYGSETEVLSRIVVRVKTGEAEDMNGIVRMWYQGKPVKERTLDLWHADGKKEKTSLSKFSIILDLDESGIISIPVTNDMPDLTRATVPAKYAVSLAK